MYVNEGLKQDSSFPQSIMNLFMLQFQICKRKAEFTGQVILLLIYLMPPQKKTKLNPPNKTEHKRAKL